MNSNAYKALRENAAWIDLAGRGKIRATGEDRARLLHAMCTNHVQDLQPGMGLYAFFLTAQGRILADANIYCMPDYLLIDTEPETKQRLWDHLDQFIIADDVTLHDFTNDWATIGIEGPKAEEVLRNNKIPVAHLPETIAEWGLCQVAHMTSTGSPGYFLFVPNEEKEEVINSLGIPQAGAEEAEVVRLENGRPKYGVDFTDANIPHETQLLDAVHFSKGCYLGQEIVERVRSRGQVNRVLTHLEIETQTPPAHGTKVSSGDKEVGQITSAALSPTRGKVVGFGILRAESLGGELLVEGAKLTPLEQARR